MRIVMMNSLIMKIKRVMSPSLRRCAGDHSSSSYNTRADPTIPFRGKMSFVDSLRYTRYTYYYSSSTYVLPYWYILTWSPHLTTLHYQ